MKPVILDLFCGAGGAAMGYYRAGFDVVGVDIVPQPRYPFEFIQGDAISVGEELLRSRNFYAVHASPPCQGFSDLKNLNEKEYLNMIPVTRELLKSSGLPYVIENVDRAPLVDFITLCGAMFPNLRVYRHRRFESNIPLIAPKHITHKVKAFTHDKRKPQYGQPCTDEMFIQVTGGGNATLEQKHKAMGIDWQLRAREINQAIPPEYTRYIGEQLVRHTS